MIHKVINNNIIITLDVQGNERILMGRGIGFKRHPGDSFDEHMIEKEFTLSVSEQNAQLIRLLNEIPADVIQAAVTIIDQAERELGKKISPGSIISLSDHIHTAIERSGQGIFVKNILLWEIRKFYPVLFDDEAGFIALHIVNAQM